MGSGFRWSVVASALIVAACGGSAPASQPALRPAQPDTPRTTTQQAPKSEPSTSSVTDSRGNLEGSSAPPANTRSLGERLFAPTMAYMINDASSAFGGIKQKCAEKFPEDMGAQANCKQKERAKFVADVLVFENKKSEAFFTIYKRTGSSLVETSKAKVTVSENTAERVRLKIVSEKGWRALFAGKKEITVASDSESSIEILDPTYGKLVYEARIGLINQDH